MRQVRLAAVLIVKDEEANLPGCLESLRGLVDEVVVYDTGSTDGTVELARAAGARVEQGHWDGDFSRARNAALAMTTATWVLSIDADERLVADPQRLCGLLARSQRLDTLAVRILNLVPADGGGNHDHAGPRLLHRAQVRWAGPLHEHPIRRDGAPVRRGECPREVLRIDHLGYADPETVRAKSRRNQLIAQGNLDALVADGVDDPGTVPRILINLGRSQVAAGELQAAVDTVETLRELTPPGSAYYVEATCVLAEVLVTPGPYEAVLALAEELSAFGAPSHYCDWLRAQALVRLDRAAEALVLLRGIDHLVDPVGRERDLGPVVHAQVVAAHAAGERDEAAAALIVAMVRHGRVAGRGTTLLGLWGPRPVGWLAELLAGVENGAFLGQTLAELRTCPEPGPQVADAVDALLLPRA
jgi:Glycosyl transferase family 2